jgi:hypothetical protein
MSSFQLQDVVTNLATAQAFSVATSAVAMGNSISLLMENAVSHEKNSQMLQDASVAQCCVLMLAAGAAKAAGG